jgi:hypothetical protein
MPRKSRKGRARYKARVIRKPLAVKEAGQRSQPLSLLSKPAPGAKPPMTMAEQDDRYQYRLYWLSDLRRAFTIAGLLLLLLVVLYFFLG